MPRVRWLSLLHRPISFKDRSGLQAHGEGAHQQCAQTHPKRLTRQQRIRCFLSSKMEFRFQLVQQLGERGEPSNRLCA